MYSINEIASDNNTVNDKYDSTLKETYIRQMKQAEWMLMKSRLTVPEGRQPGNRKTSWKILKKK